MTTTIIILIAVAAIFLMVRFVVRRAFPKETT